MIKAQRRLFFLVILLSLSSLLLDSCVTPSRFLSDGEYLVVSNEVKIIDKNVVKDKNEVLDGLNTLYSPKVNKKSLGIFQPKLRRYFKFKQKGKPLDVNNKKLHFPAMYDSLKTEKTVKKMENYLKRLGYFNAKVEVDKKLKKNKAHLFYSAYLGAPFKVGSYILTADDPHLINVLEEDNYKPSIVSGNYLGATAYKLEKSQITKILRNNGYAAFRDVYVSNMKVDSTENRLCKVKVHISNPSINSKHKVFKVGKIHVNPSFQRKNAAQDTILSDFEGIQFVSKDSNLFVQPKVLRSLVLFKENQRYNLDDLSATIRNFNKLDIYKYVNLEQHIDSINQKIDIDLDLYRTKRKEISGDILLNLTQDARKDFRFGASLSLEYKDKNFRKTTNIFSVNGTYGFQLDSITKGNASLYSRNIDFGVSLNIPRTIDGVNLFKYIVKPISKKRYKHWKNNANTQFDVKVSDNFTTGYLKEQKVKLGVSYRYKLSPNKNFGYNQLGLEFVSPELLNDSLAVRIESYQKTFFTGFLFRDAYFANYKKYSRFDRLWRMEYDLSGLEVLMSEKFISNKRYAIKDVNFAHYIKANYDVTINHRINQNQSLVFHGGFGVIANFGRWLNDSFVEKNPFSKQFALGGNNSMRAWQYLELEPGAFKADEALNFNTQSGDIRFELNLEWRFKMFWLLEGALFIDAGNIWNISKDTGLPDAEFVFSKALDQMAVATGFGTRIDLTLVLLRLDAGFKTRFSYPDELGRHFNYEGIDSWRNFRRNANIQIAIDYPF